MPNNYNQQVDKFTLLIIGAHTSLQIPILTVVLIKSPMSSFLAYFPHTLKALLVQVYL